MAELSIREILVGILSFYPQSDLPADSIAIYKAFEKFSKLHPNLFSNISFNKDTGYESFSQTIEDEINDLMFNNFLGLSGKKLENLTISPNLKTEFNKDKFTKKEVSILKTLGKNLPKMMKKNESQRYHRLKKMNVSDF